MELTMTKSLATFGLLAAAGTLTICDLCGPGARSAASGGVVSTAYAALVSRPTLIADPLTGDHAAAQQANSPRTVTLALQGMTCPTCTIATRKVLTRLPGVTRADVSYEKGTAVVTYDPAKVTVTQMIAAIKTLKYTATVVPPAAG